MASDIIARGIAAKAAGDLSQFKEETTQALAGKADLQDGKVPASQLPSYVDDVVEYADVASFPETGEFGKIYVAIDTGYTYRWAGTDYIQIGGQDLSDIVTSFAQDYDNTATYAVGDFCTYENVFYVCSTAIDVAEEWNAAHWTRTNVATVIEARDAQIAALQQSVAKLGADLASPYNPTLTYKVGDLVMVDDELWKCVTAINPAEAWDPTHWTKVQVGDVFADKNYFGFKRIPAPASTTLTEQEFELFKHGVVVDGTFLDVKNPVFTPAIHTIGTDYYGLILHANYIGMYAINNARGIMKQTQMLFNKGVLHVTPPNMNVNVEGFFTFRRKDLPKYPSDTTKPYALEQNVGGNLAWNEKINNLAPEYDATATYAVGDVVMHDGALYQCTTAIDPAEAWDATHWTQVKVDDVYADKNYFGFKQIDPPASTTLTTEEVELFKNNNVAIKGTFLGQKDPIFKSGGVSVYSPYNYFGVVILPAGIRLYQIDANNVISLSAGGMELFQYGTVRNFDVNLKAARDVSLNPGRYLYFRNKQFPAYPTTNANPANLQIAPNGGNLSWKEVINNLAPEYDATATYAVGDVCMHDGALYQCTTAIATAEAWDSTHWAQVKVDDVYANLGKIAAGNVPQDGVLGIDANNNIVKGNLFGKYVRIMDAPTNQVLTQEQINAFTEGVFLKGIFLGFYNPIILPNASTSGNYLYYTIMGIKTGGFPLQATQIGTFHMGNNPAGPNYHKPIFDKSYISFGAGEYDTRLLIMDKKYPDYPTDTSKQYMYTQLTDGTLAWQEQLYGPSVSDNTITELTYEKISVLSLSADKTFTLKAAQTDCIPEYKALITNTGSSAITLTFTGVGTIHTNDPNISLVAGTNSTATIPANTKVEVNIFDGDAIVYNKSAISYATNAEVEALYN